MSWSCLRCAAAAALDVGFNREQDADARDKRLAKLVRDLFLELGPTFVKLGQALSVRPDVINDALLREFQEFQDSVVPFPHEEAMQIVKSELFLGALEDCFSDFSSAPVAAASLGQVYRARLLDGSVVAVKVQRPNLNDKIGLDMLLARLVAKLVMSNCELLPKGLQGNDYVGFVDAFGQRVFEELDYENEVRNAQRFARLYGDQARLKVPKMYPEFTTRHVIVMEWISGVKLTNTEGIRALGLDPLDFISIGIECSMRQLLEHGFFHADPHPGNFFATPEGELCVIDFGLMSEMPKDARLSLIQHVVHLVNRDYLGMARDYHNLGFLSRDIDVRPIAPKLEAFFEPRLRAATVSAINFKTIVDGLGEVVFKTYPFTIPSFYALIVRSLVTLEGLALSIDRDFRVLAAGYPYVARRILLDADLRQSLVELLFDSPARTQATLRQPAARFRWDRAVNLLRESSKSSVAMPAAVEVAAVAPGGAAAAVATAAGSGGKASDGAMLLDLAAALLADPAFRDALLLELATTVDVLLAEVVGNAVDRLVHGEEAADGGSSRKGMLEAFGLRGEDLARASQVRDTVGLLAERLAAQLPSGAEALPLAARLAGEAMSQALGQRPKAPPLPAPTAGAGGAGAGTGTGEPEFDYTGALLNKLGERVAVRTLRALARLVGPEDRGGAAGSADGRQGAESGSSDGRRSAEKATPEAQAAKAPAAL